ncbi:MAG: ABC transporter permease, partial [Pseudomonadota bacterium]
MANFLRFVGMRAVFAVITLLIVSFLVFGLMELVPGDCAERYLAYKNTQGQNLTREDIDAERVRLGLDQPFLHRWVTWVSGAFRGEFGESCILRVSISQLLGSKFWISAGICFAALFVAYLIAIPVGIYAAASRSPVVNNILRFVSYLGLALPNFLLALIIMLIATVYFGDSLSGLFSKEFRDAPWSW